MNFQELVRMVQQVPFQPFEIQVSSGERYIIAHPECLIVSKTTSLILQKDPEFPHIMSEDWVRIANLHVNHIRLLQPA